MNKLFLLSYAGGTTGFFYNLATELAEDFECIPIEYAGHLTRSREPFYDSFETMVNDVSNIIKKQLYMNEPFSILGYSMGGLVAYEALTGPLKEYSCKHLFVAAHYPPDMSELRKKYSQMTDKELCDVMGQFGGLDKRIITNKRFLNIYLSVIKKDYQLLEEYTYDGNKTKLSCNITVFYSEEDTAYQVMKGWENYTLGETIFHQYTGNHFFLKRQEKVLANDIRKAFSSNISIM